MSARVVRDASALVALLLDDGHAGTLATAELTGRAPGVRCTVRTP